MFTLAHSKCLRASVAAFDHSATYTRKHRHFEYFFPENLIDDRWITLVQGLAYLFLGKPTPTVDYVAKINEPLVGTPIEDRAWPLVRDVILQMKMPSDMDELRRAMPLPGETAWPQAARWVSENAPLMPVLIEASRRRSFGFVYGNDATKEFMQERAAARGETSTAADGPYDPLMPPLLSVLLPHLSDVRDIGRLLVLHSRDRLSHDDFIGSWEALDACHRLSALLLEGQTLIEQLFGVSTMAMAQREMRRIFTDRRDSISPEQMSVVTGQSGIMSEPGSPLIPNYMGVQLFFHDVVQYVFTDDGNGNGRLIPGQFARLQYFRGVAWMADVGQGSDFLADANYLRIAAMHADRRQTLAKYQEVWDLMRDAVMLPLHDARREQAIRRFDEQMSEMRAGGRFAVVREMFPHLFAADCLMREADMEIAATRTVAALLRFRLDKGEFPESLEDLLPGYISNLPVDVHNGFLLQYRRDANGGPLLYSVGRNGRDDGGSLEKDADQTGPSVTQDIIYWPVTANRTP